ncbi:MAG: hypothetical protein WCI73_20215, partial [Phycisphaerae bacterium]
MNTLTKVFIVLQLAFSIGLAVVVVMAVGGDKDAKDKIHNENIGKNAAVAAFQGAQNEAALSSSRLAQSMSEQAKQIEAIKADLAKTQNDLALKQTALDTLQSEKAEAQANLSRVSASLNSATDRLAAREKEVDTMRPEFAKLREQNAQLTTANQQLQDKYDLADKAIKTLQETIAELKEKPADTSKAAAGTAGTVAQLFAGTPAPIQINGKITEVKNIGGQTMLTLALGTRDHVQQGTRLTIYRDKLYLGDALVQKATADESIAMVTLTA